MPQTHVYHVVPIAEGQWAARFGDDGHAETYFTREEALRRARDEAASHPPSEVLVHRRDGSVEERFAWETSSAVQGAERGASAAARTEDEPPVKSRASIGGHPVHPMLIPLPIGLLTFLPISDVIYWATGDYFWARMSWFLAVAGIITAGLAALVGLVDFVAIKRVRA